MQEPTISLTLVMWLVGGLMGIISLLVGVIWTTFSGEIKRSAIYRHHIAPKKFAEIDTTLMRHDTLIDSHAQRLEGLEDRYER